jgi:hypothetical protein
MEPVMESTVTEEELEEEEEEEELPEAADTADEDVVMA